VQRRVRLGQGSVVRDPRLRCWLCWVVLVLGGVLSVRAEERDTYRVKSAFREAVTGPAQSTVRVLCDGRRVALGTIVSADGFILTKASELKGEAVCQLPDGQKLDAKLMGVREDFDLAMLRVEAKSLPAIVWSDTPPPVGSWLATPGMGNLPVAIGVVSATPRFIQRRLPALGIVLDEGAEGPRIHAVVPDSGAAKAGLQRDDVVTHLNGKRVEKRDELISSIRELRPGDKVQLKLLRGGKEQTAEVMLGELAQLTMGQRDQFQNSLGGPLSERRAGFPLALQHDTVLQPNQCGGPVVDLDGKVVGLNIARASRVASYALPASSIKPLLDDLKSGKLVTTTPTN
jgi:serine protease Do